MIGFGLKSWEICHWIRQTADGDHSCEIRENTTVGPATTEDQGKSASSDQLIIGATWKISYLNRLESVK